MPVPLLRCELFWIVRFPLLVIAVYPSADLNVELSTVMVAFVLFRAILFESNEIWLNVTELLFVNNVLVPR